MSLTNMDDDFEDSEDFDEDELFESEEIEKEGADI